MATVSPPPVPNIAALETHLSKTTTPICYLLLESLGFTSIELDHIASHLSLCTGIVTTLRSIPFRVQRGEFPLPLDICARYNFVQENVFRQGPDAPGLKDVVLEVATRGNDHLNTARQYIEDLRSKDKKLLEKAFCVFLPAVYPITIF
jgi:NADH dehydrogenase [ubiquinone] 1 alpha subcomplex assembly factor 6